MQAFVLVLYTFACIIKHSSAAYTPCAEMKDCIEGDECPVDFGFKLGTCNNGLCSCFNENSEYAVPKNCKEEKKGTTCQKACLKASTANVKYASSYICGKRCFCTYKLDGVEKCGATEGHNSKFDCGYDCTNFKDTDKKKKECKVFTPELDDRCTGANKTKTCSSSFGYCFCKGAVKDEYGTLSTSKCVEEPYCANLCTVPKFDPPPIGNEERGQLCTRVVNGVTHKHCFCPTKG